MSFKYAYIVRRTLTISIPYFAVWVEVTGFSFSHPDSKIRWAYRALYADTCQVRAYLKGTVLVYSMATVASLHVMPCIIILSPYQYRGSILFCIGTQYSYRSATVHAIYDYHPLYSHSTDTVWAQKCIFIPAFFPFSPHFQVRIRLG